TFSSWAASFAVLAGLASCGGTTKGGTDGGTVDGGTANGSAGGPAECPSKVAVAWLRPDVASKVKATSATNGCAVNCMSETADKTRCDQITVSSDVETTCTVRVDFTDGTSFTSDAKFVRDASNRCPIYGSWVDSFLPIDGGTTEAGTTGAHDAEARLPIR